MITITKTIKLDHCYICLCPGDEGNKLHSHHVVPRAYGGIDGPTVTLCTSHHSGIHDAALACYPNRFDKMNQWLEKLPYLSQSHERFYYLVNVIMNARRLMSKDENKRTGASLSLPPQDAKKLDQIREYLSLGNKKMSRQDAIISAIRALHSSLGIK